MARVEFVSYTGEYPNLCSGRITLRVDGKEWSWIGLGSGGSVSFTEDWTEVVEQGEWHMDDRDWPEGFPVDCRTEALQVINDNAPWGCCGGCV